MKQKKVESQGEDYEIEKQVYEIEKQQSLRGIENSIVGVYVIGTVKQLYKKKDKMRIWMTRGDIQESKRKNLIRCTPCEN